MSLIPDTEAFEAARKAHFAVILHKPEDFEGMRRAGRLAAEVLDLMVPLVKPGVTTAELDKAATPEAMSRLRQAKRRANAAIGLADIAGAWDLEAVTGGLTRIAESALSQALRHLLATPQFAPLPGHDDSSFGLHRQLQ